MNQLYHESAQNASGADENILERPGYYAIIPSDVRYDDRIPANAKLLYGEISALAHRAGFCYARNEYFIELYQFSDATIRRLLSALEDNGYIRREYERDEKGQVLRRKIWILPSVTCAQPPLNFERTPDQKKSDPPLKNERENNTVEHSLSTRTRGQTKSHTLDDGQMDQLITQSIGTLGNGNGWNRDEKNTIYRLVKEFYAPRAIDGKPPKHTPRGVNGLFRKLAPAGKCTAKAAENMLLEAIERGWTSVYPREEKKMAAAAPPPDPSEGGVYKCL